MAGRQNSRPPDTHRLAVFLMPSPRSERKYTLASDTASFGLLAQTEARPLAFRFWRNAIPLCQPPIRRLLTLGANDQRRRTGGNLPWIGSRGHHFVTRPCSFCILHIHAGAVFEPPFDPRPLCSKSHSSKNLCPTSSIQSGCPFFYCAPPRSNPSSFRRKAKSNAISFK